MIALLAIIYAAFISLGLPDSLLGSAWPSMYESLGVQISNAGIISMIIAGGTIVSSLFSDKLIRKFGTGFVTLISVAMTAAALLGISFSGSFIVVCLCAIPLGLGAGSVDAALNNFVALHYQAAHMNWLHCFWGIGASIGPVILSFFLTQYGSWERGYRTISAIQFLLVAVLLFSLPLWKRAQNKSDIYSNGEGHIHFGISQLLKLPKAKQTLVSFFCYCSLEASVGLWSSSYLVLVRYVSEEIAAGWSSLFFIGITVGRFISGFLAIRFVPKIMIRMGQSVIGIGIVSLLIPLNFMSMAGLFLIGLGCAPIYPSLLHETPNTFGKEHSQAIMGIQMASAYVGTTFMPPLFGMLAAFTGYGFLPIFLSASLVLMVFMVGMIYKKSWVM